MTGVTIYDVAARAGVSIKSVSRVVNGESSVSPELAARVQAAIDALGYRRNLSARTLAGSSSSIIAAVVDAELTIGHWKSGRGNDYLSRLELGALMEVRKADCHLMVELLDHGSPSLERDLSALLGAIRPDGVILTPPNSDHPVVLDGLEAAGVAFARISPEVDLHRGICVRIDEAGAAAEATTHLLDLGHTRIAHVAGPAAYAASRLRREGFDRAMADAGHAPDAGLVVEGDFTFESGVTAARILLQHERPPTAIFAANDDMALGVLQAAKAAGMRTPADLSVVGFDDTPSALFSSPQLTTIRQPVAELAAAAAQRLIPRLRESFGQAGTGNQIVLAHRLILRESTDARA